MMRSLAVVFFLCAQVFWFMSSVSAQVSKDLKRQIEYLSNQNAPSLSAYSAAMSDLELLTSIKKAAKSPASIELMTMMGVAGDGIPYADLKNPTAVFSEQGSRELNTEFRVNYGVNKAWNPKLKKIVDLRLRSYNGNLVGPTLRVKPGDTIKAKIINDLPENASSFGSVNEPHDFNTTNLHTCLLYTSPSPRDGLLSRMPSSA